MQPSIATGTIGFAELENLIITYVHQKWDTKHQMHNIELTNGPPDEEFEMDGEIYKLEMKGGRRVPVKQNKPKGEFKGKCFKCNRRGHLSRDCKHTTKLDGSPVSTKKATIHFQFIHPP